ncbi:MAG TPA: protein kinase [Gemmatimonadales bacterium]|jgi:serine/threonine protein kinase/tetratricopeptide (TPR) repeat protein
MAEVVADELTRLQTALAERYTIERELGQGGMAHVYLARDLRHGRDVALKVLRPELAAGLGSDRFLREIRIEASLQHPHILPLHDSGVAEGLLYYVMPFVKGETLRDRLAREKQLPIADAMRIAREVADALGYAHANNIVHRDIKPANILLSADHAVVADFGIARAITIAAGDQVTETGLAVGTPDYMSPEQATGETSLDGRTDVYALGCVLYEMLAGDPPFRGRTAQATLARHLNDPPPPIRVRRPNIPVAVESALNTALAKVPADRFSTAADFAKALEAGPARRPRRRVSSLHHLSIRIGVLVTAALISALAYWQYHRTGPVALDSNRVVVFPLQDGSPGGKEAGDEVATYIGYALDGTAPLTWMEGRDYLSEAELNRQGTLPTPVARRISRAQRAGFYIDGSVVKGRDSVTIVLRLHDVAGDSVLRRAGASSHSANASLPQLGLRATGDLLPALLEPGRKVDLTALSERNPTAIANFLQGEREYRRMRFGAALDHYRKALSEDSALAIAALKGAEAANWPGLTGDRELIDLALQHQAALSPRLTEFARGLRDYLVGSADSAVSRFRRALAIDSTWSEAWMALGEVYYHLLPQATSLDSLAESAFLQAHQYDSTFTPPLFHLAQIALRRRDTRSAERLLRRLQQADPDSTFSRSLSLMYQCVRDGPAQVPWREAAERRPADVLSASAALAGGGANPACAEAGYQAVLGTANQANRWGALLGLQALLAATGQVAAVDSVLARAEGLGLPGRLLYLLDAAATTGFEKEAAAVALQRGRLYDSMPSPNLWLLGEWEAHRGNLEHLRAIAGVATRRAGLSGDRTDSLFARILEAHAVRIQGDSARAISLLAGLRPSAAQADLVWQPWEALAGERLALAQLYLARHQAAEADRVAAEIDSHRAVVYLVYLPASLELRARAARSLGRSDLAAAYVARLAALRRGAASSVRPGVQPPT